MSDKNIFKPDINGINRFRTIDMHNYTEVSSEKFFRKDTLIEVTLSGCDNLSLFFDIHLKNVCCPETRPSYRQKTADMLEFLSTKTRYPTLLKKILNHFQNTDYTPNEFPEYKVDKNLKYRISGLNYNEKEKTIDFRIFIDNISNPHQTENWEITTRNKLPVP